MKTIFVNGIEFRKEGHDLPLGIMSLATVCNLEDDIEASIVDFGSIYSNGKLDKFPTLEENLEVMCKYLLDFEPDIISFYSLCSFYHLNVMLSKRLKERNPYIVILFGGPHASLTAADTLRAFPWVDYIGVDEGEQTIVPLLRGALLGKVEDLHGVAFRGKDNDREIIVKRAPICDVDKLPMIDYSLRGVYLSKTIPIDVGRGCPFGCVYCSTKTFWKQSFRLKSVERIIFEISYLQKKYNISNFSFVHDLFTTNKKMVFDFCDTLVERGISINWSCSARLDTLSDDLLNAMYKAGCKWIFIGIESGSQRMQKIINKNLDLNLITNLIDYIQKYEINFICSFIYGFPEETITDLESTLQIILRLWKVGAKTIQLHKATFLPGTSMYDQYYDLLKYNQLCTDFTEQSYINDEAKEYIIQNKSVFPQFYTVPSIATQYPYLDIFVLYFYTTIYSYMPITNKALIELVGEGILTLYISFQSIILDLFESISSNGGIFMEDLYRTDRIFEVIRLYLERLLLPDYESIFEVAIFEIDAVYFLRGSETSCTRRYSFDVLSLIASEKVCLAAEKREIGVVFKKLETETISVKYVLD